MGQLHSNFICSNLTFGIIPSNSLLPESLCKYKLHSLFQLAYKAPWHLSSPLIKLGTFFILSPTWLYFYCHLLPAATIFLLTDEMTLNLLSWILPLPFFFQSNIYTQRKQFTETRTHPTVSPCNVFPQILFSI